MKTGTVEYDNVLFCVNKPSRYVGSEWNTVNKKRSAVDLSYVLIYPDVYEVGMSNVGLKILYSIVNGQENLVAERCFAPWLDMEKVLRERSEPLTSLESGIPLQDFDVIGFTLPHELCYTNILNILDLARLPILAEDRKEVFPLVIGGGAGAFNPEPVAMFFDAFVLGDGEEVIIELSNLLVKLKKQQLPKKEVLRELASVEGVYVPSLYSVSYAQNGGIKRIEPAEGIKESIEKRIVTNLDACPYPVNPVVPYIELVHDRLNIEIMRGCTRGCRFCQAGMVYRPVRERGLERVLQLTEQSIQSTGYSEISLSSLSSSDYSNICPLIEQLLEKNQTIHLSLPSLRPDTISLSLAEAVEEQKKFTLTLAPEAGSQKMRNIINKGLSEEDLIQAVGNAVSRGWLAFKFYFMLGLPMEEKEDVEGILVLAEKALKEARTKAKEAGFNSSRVRITVSVGSFVPKAHTPFQWAMQEKIETLTEKQLFLKDKIRSYRQLDYKWHSPEMSFIEAVFSRGDRRLAKVLENVWRQGGRFDNWSELFNFSRWQKAFADEEINAEFYANRVIPKDEIFPWEHLSSRVTKEFLAREYKKSLSGQLTSDCRWGSCSDCGVCQNNGPKTSLSITKPIAKKEKPAQEITSYTYQACLKITDNLKFISHLEMMRLLERAFRRANLNIAYSCGYHPHPKISSSLALGVGVGSQEEIITFKLLAFVKEEDLLERINRNLPSSLQFTKITACEKPLSFDVKGAIYRVRVAFLREADQEVFLENINNFLLCENNYSYTNKKGKKTPLKELISKITSKILKKEVELEIHLNLGIKPQEALQYFTQDRFFIKDISRQRIILERR